MKNKSSKSIILGFFAIAFLCTGFFVIKTYQNIQETKLQNLQMNTSLQFLFLTENVLLNLQQLEKNEWEYLSKQTVENKNYYQQSIEEIIGDSIRLHNSLKNNSEYLAEILQLKGLLTRKIQNANELINGLLKYDSTDTELKVDLVSSKKIADSIKTKIFNTEQKSRKLLAGPNQYLENIALNTNYSFFIFALIFFAILIIFSLILNKELKKEAQSTVQLNYQASLINTIPDAIFTTDENYIVKSWNNYAAELYDISEEEAIGKSINELYKIDKDKEALAQDFLDLKTHGYFKGEFPIIKKNGERIIILLSMNSIANEENKSTGYIALHRNITQSKKLEAELKQFNSDLENQVKNKTSEITNILDRITDGFLALDENFTFTFVNNKAGEILGYLPYQISGKNIFNDFDEIKSADFNNACFNALNTQQFVFFENYYSQQNIWIENYIYPSSNGLSVFFKDVTFKRKAELSIKESEERYRNLIVNLQTGVIVLNPDTSISLCNFEASRLFNFLTDPADNNKYIIPDWQYFSEDGRALSKHEFPVEQVIATLQPIENIVLGIETEINKTRIWVQINAYPELDKLKNLEHVIITFVDITPRINAAEKIKQNEDTLNRAQAIAKIGNWEFSLLTTDLLWSNELYKIFEIDPDSSEDLYLAYRNRYHPEDLSKLDELVQLTIETKKGYKYQHRIILNNGDIKHILGIGEVLLNKKGALIGLKGTAQDITDIIKAEEKLQVSYKQIRQLVIHLQNIREEERTNIAREIHDELGQQLTGLKMQVSLLSKKVVAPSADIKDKFSYTIELIEETIASVRKISTDLRPSMLDDLGLIAALEWQSNEFEKRTGLSTEFINLTRNIEIPTRLTTGIFRIFQESLTNIARHADAEKIVATIKFENGTIILEVMDDGKGFEIKNIESKKTLGLFGMKERTLEMGGEYQIQSKLGLGTTVTVNVPI